MYGLGSHGLALKNTHKELALWKIARIAKKSKEQKITKIPRTSSIAERSWSATSMMSHIQKRMHEQRYTQTDMTEFHRKNVGKEELRSLLLMRGVTAETYSPSCSPSKEEAATPCSPQNPPLPLTLLTPPLPNTSNLVHWKRELYQSLSKSRCRTVVIVVMVIFQQGRLGGIILHHRTHGDSHPDLPYMASQHTA